MFGSVFGDSVQTVMCFSCRDPRLFVLCLCLVGNVILSFLKDNALSNVCIYQANFLYMFFLLGKII